METDFVFEMIVIFPAVFFLGSKITAGYVGNATISSSRFLWKDQVLLEKKKQYLACLFAAIVQPVFSSLKVIPLNCIAHPCCARFFASFSARTSARAHNVKAFPSD